MGKIKTKKCLKKALNIRQSGSITIGHPGANHKTGLKNAKYNRKKRTASSLSKADQNRLKNVL